MWITVLIGILAGYAAGYVAWHVIFWLGDILSRNDD